MKDFKLNAQDHIIDDILSHLENGTIGMGIARKYDYERKGNTLYFVLKPGEEIDPADIFWFGYLTNQ